MSLENLFKHKVPIFFTVYEGDLEDRNLCKLGYYYDGKWIEDGSKVGINNPNDLYEKLTPFIRYLISKIRYEILAPVLTSFDVYLSIRNENGGLEIVKVIHFELDDNFTVDGILLLHYLGRYDDRLFKVPFYILVKAYCYFAPGEIREGVFATDGEDENEDEVNDDESKDEVNDDESEDEVEEQLIPIEDHFKIDQCVICMEKEPCILFIQCRHICVCLSCETAKPSLKCPFCRSKIYQKIKF